MKAAIFGSDPNWGRVLATVGARAGTLKLDLEPANARVEIQKLCVYDHKPQLTEPERLRARMREPVVRVDIELRAGAGQSLAWGCDLSYDYVKINADYTSLIKTADDGSVAKDDRLTNYSPKFKVTLVTQALSYISKFAGKRCVLKVGRQTLAKDSLLQAFCEDVALLKSVGLQPIVVHGEAPHDPAQDAQLRELLVTGATNAGLVSLIHRNGATAVGISGHDGALLEAKTNPVRDDGLALGEIVRVNSQLIEMFLCKGYVPVIAPLGMGKDGTRVPLDADCVASEVAVALKAAKLVYLTGRQGITDNDELLRQQTTSQLEAKLLGTGGFTPNIIGKSRGALHALSNGVDQVHVIDARLPHSLIAELFTDDGVGTLVTRG